jgi:hypothetical protein
MEVTTIHVLGLDEASGDMEVAYDSALQVPVAMETLEVCGFSFHDKLILELEFFSSPPCP